MRILLCYATREGQTAKIAERLTDHLRADGAEVRLVNAAEPPDATALAQADLLVFGTSMHAGGLEAELVNCINAQRDIIQHKPRAFFLVLLSAATRDAALREKWLADARAKMDS